MIKENKIILALDTNNFNKASSIISSIDANIIFKLGMEFFFSFGYEGIEKIKSIRPNIKIFLDLKLHDIPNTVCKAILPLVEKIRPYMMTLHSTGGATMMQNVVKTLRKIPLNERPLLLGVTVLTSLDSKSLIELGWSSDVNQNVERYALLCKRAGFDGVICSALEIEKVRKACGNKFIIVTPGIRINKSDKDDQARVVSPEEAFNKGTDYIVIGRPVMNSSEPDKEISKILSLN